MMKWLKKVGLLALTGGLLAGGTAPVQAQDLTMKEFLNKTVVSTLQTQTVQVKLAGTVSFEGFGQVEELLNGEASAAVDLEQMASQGEVRFASYAGDYHLAFALQDGQLYGKENREEKLQTLDLSQDVAAAKELLAHYRQITDWYTADEVAMWESLLDLEEEEDGYVLRLKDSVDGKALYRQHSALMDLIKAVAVYQSYSEYGQSPTHKQTVSLIDYMFNEDAFEAFFANQPKLSFHYNKNFQLVRVDADLKFSVEEEAEAGPGFDGLLRLQGQLLLSHYGEPVEVTRP